ncbi:hypothetical protein A2291_00370 [candidate division WOR-1 bacterium RIFOXYB2_FULL_42_35]|uniref:Uncharacterized protein n=1 Tax=candidate division WOR-1 bacterium RIFOXYC2_FULL_41_25 TaxID=1802586 RepID=A0A1F4TMF1_UNCSA|nr:MAG: hypothetical protein A2247_01505 [candidate division WOR-1 bacterium RIFOXYA2_FULL_41_14]OGC24255.1 MAG: hypothetical protein A2291_00370 [candidate division WOR-1 bacterium RIFOXYB2_FULL_42_35]OGC33898.1 MAG: hypothetical protein A2462_01340 [candidate division WOR-1 bacterium RIFOXYC2_FULL_41_25]
MVPISPLGSLLIVGFGGKNTPSTNDLVSIYDTELLAALDKYDIQDSCYLHPAHGQRIFNLPLDTQLDSKDRLADAIAKFLLGKQPEYLALIPTKQEEAAKSLALKLITASKGRTLVSLATNGSKLGYNGHCYAKDRNYPFKLYFGNYPSKFNLGIKYSDISNVITAAARPKTTPPTASPPPSTTPPATLIPNTGLIIQQGREGTLRVYADKAIFSDLNKNTYLVEFSNGVTGKITNIEEMTSDFIIDRITIDKGKVVLTIEVYVETTAPEASRNLTIKTKDGKKLTYNSNAVSVRKVVPTRPATKTAATPRPDAGMPPATKPDAEPPPRPTASATKPTSKPKAKSENGCEDVSDPMARMAMGCD